MGHKRILEGRRYQPPVTISIQQRFWQKKLRMLKTYSELDLHDRNYLTAGDLSETIPDYGKLCNWMDQTKAGLRDFTSPLTENEFKEALAVMYEWCQQWVNYPKLADFYRKVLKVNIPDWLIITEDKNPREFSPTYVLSTLKSLKEIDMSKVKLDNFRVMINGSWKKISVSTTEDVVALFGKTFKYEDAMFDQKYFDKHGINNTFILPAFPVGDIRSVAAHLQKELEIELKVIAEEMANQISDKDVNDDGKPLSNYVRVRDGTIDDDFYVSTYRMPNDMCDAFHRIFKGSNIHVLDDRQRRSYGRFLKNVQRYRETTSLN